jgi:hypothetical protein
MEQVEPPQHTIFVLQKSLSTPSHISSLAFGHAGHLFAGSGIFVQLEVEASLQI